MGKLAKLDLCLKAFRLYRGGTDKDLPRLQQQLKPHLKKLGITRLADFEAGRVEGDFKLHEVGPIQTELTANDYVHFYADQQHMARNVGDEPTELFVVRNYMIKGGGSRRRLYAHASSFEEALLRGKSQVKDLRKTYIDGIGRWLRQ